MCKTLFQVRYAAVNQTKSLFFFCCSRKKHKYIKKKNNKSGKDKLYKEK